MGEEEYRPCSMEDGGVDLVAECEDEDSLIQWYIALRAADRFREEQGHWPGCNCVDTDAAGLASDLAGMTQCAAKIIAAYKVEGAAADSKMLEEVVRFGGSELHTTSSVLGGIAAQEAVKLATKQY